MSILSKKALLTLSIPAVLGLFVGALGMYLLGNNNDVPKQNTVVIEQPRRDPAPNTDPALPEGTVSPTTIVEDHGNYQDKELRVRGHIIKIDDKYVIMGQEKERPAGLELITESSAINLEQYKGPDDKSGQAVTVVGTVRFELNSLKLFVYRIE